VKKLKLFETKRVTRVEINSFIQKKVKELLPKIERSELSGSSPPEIFVGHAGYPRVYVGPLVPPVQGDTSFLSKTEAWWGKSLQEIIDMRLTVVRGKKKLKVMQLEDRYAQKLREMLLSKISVDSELKIRKLSTGFSFSRYHQPFGPSVLVEDFYIAPSKTDFKIEKVFYDTDLKATEAMLWLYEKGVEVSRIQQVLSAGLIGLKQNRKFVPTRWSITAVDDTLSKALIDKIKEFPVIDEYRVYYTDYLDNRWVVMMIPSLWSYESIEAWYPGTLLNEFAIGGDYEGFEGRKDYASIGGCYYSGRLAVAEKLFEEKRQASVLILREIHPGYAVPVGVWNVRETVRRLMQTRPALFDCLDKALEYASKKLDIPLKVWIENSVILKRERFQKNLLSFLSK